MIGKRENSFLKGGMKTVSKMKVMSKIKYSTTAGTPLCR